MPHGLYSGERQDRVLEPWFARYSAMSCEMDGKAANVMGLRARRNIHILCCERHACVTQ